MGKPDGVDSTLNSKPIAGCEFLKKRSQVGVLYAGGGFVPSLFVVKAEARRFSRASLRSPRRAVTVQTATEGTPLRVAALLAGVLGVDKLRGDRARVWCCGKNNRASAEQFPRCAKGDVAAQAPMGHLCGWL